MRIDVVPTADAVTPERVAGVTALVVDVLRASTTIIAALASGADGIVPVAHPDDARSRAGTGVLVAGERRGEKLPGFDLGNSPVEFSATPLLGRTVVFTTSNGTRALLATRGAAAVGIAALVNASAAAAWAAAQRRDVTVVCAGERGALSLEDHVCAGLLVERLRRAVADARVTGPAEAASEAARPYEQDVTRLASDSRWARNLATSGHGPDVRACLRLDTTALVPIYVRDVDKVVLTHR
jgi:2-phosphosulfolactate phosphatase